jgi:putative transposase
MSERLMGRKVSPMEISKASKSLTKAVEAWRERDLSGDPKLEAITSGHDK